MTRRLRRLVVAMALLGVLFLSGCENEKDENTREVEIGYIGPARYNPFLAAQRFLTQMGCEVRTDGTFRDLPSSSGTLVAPVESFINYGDATLVLNWVQHGGHLVLLLADGEPWRDDWEKLEPKTNDDKAEDKETPDEEQKALLDRLGIKAVDTSPGENVVVRAGERRFRAELGGELTLATSPRRDVDGGKALLSYSRGYGRVTLVADSHPFRNRYFAEQDHAALLYELVSLDHRSIISFITGMKVSFWKLLWERGQTAIICLAALLIFWLWKNLPRFGPTLAVEEPGARDFTGHLALAGNFLWRYRQVAALLLPLQQDVHAALARRGLVAEDPATQQELALRCGLTADRVRAALFIVAPEAPAIFLRTVQDLHTLRSKI